MFVEQDRAEAMNVLGEIFQIREQVENDVQAQQAYQHDQVCPDIGEEQAAIEKLHNQAPGIIRSVIPSAARNLLTPSEVE